MDWETLPAWFWILYFLFISLTVIAGIRFLMWKRKRGVTVFVIGAVATHPMIGIIYSIGREAGMNEWEHLWHHLQQGSVWAIYVTASFLFICIWWMLIFNKRGGKE